MYLFYYKFIILSSSAPIQLLFYLQSELLPSIHRNPLVHYYLHHWHITFVLCSSSSVSCFCSFLDNVTTFHWLLVACRLHRYSCFGFLDFDLIQFMNLFLSAKLPLHKRIFLSLCGFLNPLIPPFSVHCPPLDISPSSSFVILIWSS